MQVLFVFSIRFEMFRSSTQTLAISREHEGTERDVPSPRFVICHIIMTGYVIVTKVIL